MTEVALAAGYGSLRRFNETFRDLFRRPPSALRRDLLHGGGSMAGAGVTLRLSYRPPYDWPAMLGHLAARAVPGVEEVADGAYRRTVSDDGRLGSVEVRHEPARNSLAVTVRFPSVRALPAILARVRRVFDVGRRHRDHRRPPLARSLPGAASSRGVPGCARRADGTASSSPCGRSSASR